MDTASKPVAPREDNDSQEQDRTRNTPSTDLQPDDAGTAASGNEGGGTAAEGAMKQTSKTAQESGTRGGS